MDALTTPLPKAWQKVRLGDIAEIIGGGTPSTQITSFWNGSINWFTATEIGITKYVYKSQRTITPLGLKKSSAKLLPIGTILLTSRASIGDCAILKVVATTNQDFQSLIPLEKINNEFLYYLMLTLKNKLLKLASGSIFLGVSPNKIKNLLIPLPPLDEQIAIANILSDVDRYLYSLDALILKKESVKKALSFELLSQRKRLKGFNQAWQRVRLGDILSYEQPTKFLVATTQYLQKGFTPILTAGKTFILGYTNDKHGIYTNIPVIIFDDFTTDSKMVNFPFKVKSSAIKILSLRNNNQADLKYIYEKLTLLKHQVTDHKRYWIDEFSNFEILLPPLDEQAAIANILSALDSEIISLKNKKRQFENIKKALNHDLMSAKIRVLNK
ncbi:restriction endonuclease subunit S [Helicobacter pylori]|uniref:restriction endonuclease subunit S n=1 Tax=Helicobacter pylori TaxID=210 RepID=UPI001AE995E3|nr:restriction endonuclease subunit S [Helicobacter pylori]QTO96795.1 restriction endonuclease subunit S [Helicobacter pylori]